MATWRSTFRADFTACVARFWEASPSRVLLGDDPALMLLGVGAGGLMLNILLQDAWRWFLALVPLALVAHAWCWCAHEARARGSRPASTKTR